MKATKQFFPVVLIIMLYKVVLTFEFVSEMLKCNHSDESYWAVLSCGAVYYAVQGGPNFWICGWNTKEGPFREKKATEQFFPVVPFIMLYKVVLTFDSVGEIFKCGHSNIKHYWVVLSSGAVSFFFLISEVESLLNFSIWLGTQKRFRSKKKLTEIIFPFQIAL